MIHMGVVAQTIGLSSSNTFLGALAGRLIGSHTAGTQSIAYLECWHCITVCATVPTPHVVDPKHMSSSSAIAENPVMSSFLPDISLQNFVGA